MYSGPGGQPPGLFKIVAVVDAVLGVVLVLIGLTSGPIWPLVVAGALILLVAPFVLSMGRSKP